LGIIREKYIPQRKEKGKIGEQISLLDFNNKKRYLQNYLENYTIPL
jgi:hypothetical protein